MSEELKLELKDNDSDDFTPQTPRDKPPWWEGDDPRDEGGPTHAPGSPTPDDPDLEEITQDFLNERGPTHAPGSPTPDDPDLEEITQDFLNERGDSEPELESDD